MRLNLVTPGGWRSRPSTGNFREAGDSYEEYSATVQAAIAHG
jgi:hypothetical protein